MKKFIFALMLMVSTLSVSANEIRYFTYGQAQRTVECLDHVTELLIYCGYSDEIETYCLVSEVWAEKVNSKFYEIWIYGWDAYTGDEIYMPIDLGCIWLYSGKHYYSAATYLRFRSYNKAPTFGWHMPVYNAFERRMHPHGMTRTYHYHVHCNGWVHPVWDEHNPHNLPPYYCRHHSHPAPVPHTTWTPGYDRPIVNYNGHNYLGNSRTNQTAPAPSTPTTSRNPNTNDNGPRVVTSSSRTQSGNTNGTTTSRGTSTQTNSGTTSSRGTSTQTNSGSTSSRGTSTQTNSGSTSNRGTSTQTNSGSTSSRGTSATTSTSSTSRTSGTATNSTSTTSRTSTTTTKSTSTSTRTSSTNSGSTTSRGTSTSNGSGTTSKR